MPSFSIDKKFSVCYEPFIAEPRTVVSGTVVSEYEYPAEQCNDARKLVREIYLEAPDIVNREYSALYLCTHAGRLKVCLEVPIDISNELCIYKDLRRCIRLDMSRKRHK